jgi:N-acetylglucosamine-6-phosphate deacetylase
MTIIEFINCRQCLDGQLISQPLKVSTEGVILPLNASSDDIQMIDLNNAIISPGFIELQTNGALGFHFAHEKPPAEYQAGLEKLAKYLPSTGVTGFYPTVPTVPSAVFKQVLPHLRPQDFEDGASVLGSHVEGPFIAPSKKGAHDASNMHIPSEKSLGDVYGEENLRDSIKVLTLAPELPGAAKHIKRLAKEYNIRVSMGHSAATHEEGVAGVKAGANLLTHTFNAMNPLHHREPSLPGKNWNLMSLLR